MNYKLIGGDRKEYGPVSADEIRKWISEKRLNSESMVQPEGSGTWVPLGSISEFAEQLSGLPPVSSTRRSDPEGTVLELEARIKRVDLDIDIGSCIQRAWALACANPLEMILMSVIYFGVVFGMAILGQIPCVGCFTSVAEMLFQGAFLSGIYWFVLGFVRGGKPGYGEIFAGFKRSLGDLVLGHIVIGVLSLFILLLCAGPFFISFAFDLYQLVKSHRDPDPLEVLKLFLNGWTIVGVVVLFLLSVGLSLIWIFTFPLIIDKQIPFWKAMELSRKVVFRKFIQVFAVVVLMGLINLAGFCLCCFGLLFSMPLAFAVLMYAYEDIFGSHSSV